MKQKRVRIIVDLREGRVQVKKPTDVECSLEKIVLDFSIPVVKSKREYSPKTQQLKPLSELDPACLYQQDVIRLIQNFLPYETPQTITKHLKGISGERDGRRKVFNLGDVEFQLSEKLKTAKDCRVEKRIIKYLGVISPIVREGKIQGDKSEETLSNENDKYTLYDITRALRSKDVPVKDGALYVLLHLRGVPAVGKRGKQSLYSLNRVIKALDTPKARKGTKKILEALTSIESERKENNSSQTKIEAGEYQEKSKDERKSEPPYLQVLDSDVIRGYEKEPNLEQFSPPNLIEFYLGFAWSRAKKLIREGRLPATQYNGGRVIPVWGLVEYALILSNSRDSDERIAGENMLGRLGLKSADKADRELLTEEIQGLKTKQQALYPQRA